jgi:hypothetical protein
MCTFTDFPLWLFICHLMLPYGLMEGYFFQARSQAKGTEKSTRGTKPRSLKTRGHASLPVCTNTEWASGKFWHIICKKITSSRQNSICHAWKEEGISLSKLHGAFAIAFAKSSAGMRMKVAAEHLYRCLNLAISVAYLHQQLVLDQANAK